VMMFYAEAGGERYTGLSNGYQSFVDLSGLLSTDRAILVAQGPADQRAATLLDDGQPMTDPQDRHLTVYRFVLPVQEAGGE
jgi:hypothetical protein